MSVREYAACVPGENSNTRLGLWTSLKFPGEHEKAANYGRAGRVPSRYIQYSWFGGGGRSHGTVGAEVTASCLTKLSSKTRPWSSTVATWALATLPKGFCMLLYGGGFEFVGSALSVMYY